jgi:serine/threonine-protein kinase
MKDDVTSDDVAGEARRRESADNESAPVLRTLVLTDLVGSTEFVDRIGDAAFERISAQHDRLVRDLIRHSGGIEIDKTDGFLVLFDRPIEAVAYALGYHTLLREQFGHAPRLQARAAIHLGEVFLRRNEAHDVEAGAKPVEVEGLAKPVAARLSALAAAGQTLLSRGAFDIARRAAVYSLDHSNLTWLAHGPYLIAGVAEAIDVFEVGIRGIAPLRPPVDTAKARRSVAVGDEVTLGWRPGIGLTVPSRPNWQLARKLGDGAVGEVWLAEHAQTDERRVFKFCFDPERVRALKREVALFRVLKIGLGSRSDIARVLDWNFDDPPYFLESEYSGAGDLLSWAETQGGIENVRIETRLELAALIGDAVCAAHSVGVLHKDIKPANILICEGATPIPTVQLSDFGIGLLTDDSIINRSGITRLGFTDIDPMTDQSDTGTRLYLAPELLEGKPPTIQSDIYALGVLLYQLVVGNLRKALPPNWTEHIIDDTLREDLAVFLDGWADKRPATAADFSNRLRTLEQRRRMRRDLRHAAEEAELAKRALALSRRRRRFALAVSTVLLVVTGLVAFQERRTAREAMRANREANTAQQVSDLLESVFQVSDPSEGLGRDVNARDLLDQGADRILGDRTLGPEIRARLLATIGSVYRSLGLFEEAATVLREALAATERLDEKESQALGRVHFEIGTLALEQGDLKRAEQHHRASLDIRRRGDRPEDVSSSLQGLADVFFVRGDFQTARSLLEEAVQLQRTSASAPTLGLATAIDTLASLLMETSSKDPDSPDRRQGFELYRQSLQIRRQLFGREHPEIAWGINNLAFWLQRHGEVTEAEALHREALAIKRATLGETHPSVATTLGNLAHLMLEQGAVGEATALAQEALAIRERHYAPGHWRIAQSQSILGACLARQEKHSAQADSLLRAGYETLRHELGSTANLTVEARERLKGFYQARGRSEDARRLEAEPER